MSFYLFISFSVVILAAQAQNYGGGGVPTSDCVDASDYCSDWALTGFCTSTTYTWSQKMEYCAKTCALCPLPPIITTTTTTKPDPYCYDTSESCAYWQTSGFCTSVYYSQEQKIQYCAKTCGLCRTTTTTTTTTTQKPTTTLTSTTTTTTTTTPKPTTTSTTTKPTTTPTPKPTTTSLVPNPTTPRGAPIPATTTPFKNPCRKTVKPTTPKSSPGGGGYG